MNVMTQVCGIVIMLVIIYSYLSKKKIKLYTGKAFLRIWVTLFLSLILDIASLWAITNQENLPDTVVKLLGKLYLCSLQWVVVFGLLYVCSDIYKQIQNYKFKNRCVCILSALLSIVVLMLPIQIYNGDDVVYTYGMSVNVIYAIVLAWIAVILYMMYRYKMCMNPKRRESVFILLVLWLCAAIIQWEYRELLIVSFAGTMGVLVMYVNMETPDINLDKRTGLFNQNAFLQYTKEISDRGKSMAILCIGYTHNFYENVGTYIDRDEKDAIIQYISTLKNCIAFKGSSENIKLIFETETIAQSIIKKISERFEKPWGVDNKTMIKLRSIYLPDTKMLNDIDDSSMLFKYVSYGNVASVSKNYTVVDEEIVRKFYEEQDVEDIVLEAIRNNRIEVFYQPIFSTDKNKFVSAEALARIKKENGEYVMPGIFIKVAENKGFIIKLGSLVFENVCRFVSENDMEALGLEYIEVNLSVIQCGYEMLAEDFIAIMEKYKVNPKYINLEITESASLTSKQILLENMEKLREYGILFSLDDFGTGQSNLNYIVDMPVDIVKFDRGMIQSYFDSDKAKFVMDAAMWMIKGLKLEIVSEGIETEEQFEVMKNLGIQYIQGYYFSKPLKEDVFIEFVNKENTKEKARI